METNIRLIVYGAQFVLNLLVLIGGGIAYMKLIKNDLKHLSSDVKNNTKKNEKLADGVLKISDKIDKRCDKIENRLTILETVWKENKDNK